MRGERGRLVGFEVETVACSVHEVEVVMAGVMLQNLIPVIDGLYGAVSDIGRVAAWRGCKLSIGLAPCSYPHATMVGHRKKVA